MLQLCCCGSFTRPKKVQQIEDRPLPPSPIAAKTGERICYLPTPNLSTISGPLASDATNAPSDLRGGDIELDKLILDDSDEDENALQSKKKLSSGALDAVKTKIVRRLSYEKNMKRRSQSSVGNTEESINRRAELRRLRTKRIQEELCSDQSNNDSARTSIRSTKYLSPFIDIGRPGHGPRDAIEFSVASCPGSQGFCPPVDPDPVSRSGYNYTNVLPVRRRNSCPNAIGDGEGHGLENSGFPSRSKSVPPSASKSQPSRPRNALCAASKPSLEQNSPPTPPGSDAVTERLCRENCESPNRDSQSALGMWLMAQEIRSRDSSTVKLDDLADEKSRGYRSSIISQQLYGIDAMIEESYPILRQDSRYRASQTSIQHADGVPLQQKHSQSNRAETGQQKRKGLYLKAPSNTEEEETTTSSTPIDHSSSVYPSAIPSFQPSPTRSKSLVNILTSKDLESLELSPFQWHDESSVFRHFGPSEDCSSYATADEGERSQHGRSGTFLNTSHNLHNLSHMSDSESVQQREPKLSSIQLRFSDALGRHKPPPPTKSRFKEVFSETNKSKYVFPFMEKIGWPVFGRHASGYRIPEDSLSRRIMPGAWSRAPSSTTMPNGETEEPPTQAPITVVDSIADVNSAQLKTLRQNNESRNSLTTTQIIVEDYKYSRMSATTLGGRLLATRRATQPFSTVRSRTYKPLTAYDSLRQVSKKSNAAPPLSWARYPSPTRKDRIQSDIANGSVSSKDFAVRIVTSDGGVQWTTDRQPTLSEERNSLRASSFPTKLTHSLRSRLTKVKLQLPYAEGSGTKSSGSKQSRLLKTAPGSQSTSSSLFVSKRRQRDRHSETPEACLPHRAEPPDVLMAPGPCSINTTPKAPDDNRPALRESESGQLTEVFVTPQSSFRGDTKHVAED